jgi:hypothetical protein
MPAVPVVQRPGTVGEQPSRQQVALNNQLAKLNESGSVRNAARYLADSRRARASSRGRSVMQLRGKLTGVAAAEQRLRSAERRLADAKANPPLS